MSSQCEKLRALLFRAMQTQPSAEALPSIAKLPDSSVAKRSSAPTGPTWDPIWDAYLKKQICMRVVGTMYIRFKQTEGLMYIRMK